MPFPGKATSGIPETAFKENTSNDG
jgi:hypothetical protein